VENKLASSFVSLGKVFNGIQQMAALVGRALG